jgi:multimeric flavodoxin WrbA
MLCASPRKESNTLHVLEECAKNIADNGLEAEIVSLRQMKIRSCIACGKCAELH